MLAIGVFFPMKQMFLPSSFFNAAVEMLVLSDANTRSFMFSGGICFVFDVLLAMSFVVMAMCCLDKRTFVGLSKIIV